MRMPVFQDVNGQKTAVNPDNVISVVYGGERFTDINFVGGGTIRVPLSFENTIARLTDEREVGPH